MGLTVLTQEAEEWQDDDEATQTWLLLLKTCNKVSPQNHGGSPSVTQHNDDVAKRAKSIAEAVGLRLMENSVTEFTCNHTVKQILPPNQVISYRFELAKNGKNARYFTYAIEGEN